MLGCSQQQVNAECAIGAIAKGAGKSGHAGSRATVGSWFTAKQLEECGLLVVSEIA